MSRILMIIAFTVFLVSAPMDAVSQSLDIEHAPAPLFTCPVDNGPSDPTIIWNEQRGEWWIMYTQRRANRIFSPGVTYCYGTPIGIAASRDGKYWYYVGEAVFPDPAGVRNSYWAPHVFRHGKDYHMIVTFIEGVHQTWGGTAKIRHYKSRDLLNWSFVTELEDCDDCIDGTVHRMPDGTWKMWFKNRRGQSETAISKNLRKWVPTGHIEIADTNHEGDVVFRWKDKFWNIVDPCTLSFSGLKVYESDDASNWTYNNTILNTPGQRRDDREQGRHADVLILDDRALIIYCTHPDRRYDERGVEIYEPGPVYQRSVLQIAELEYLEGKIVCDRDK